MIRTIKSHDLRFLMRSPDSERGRLFQCVFRCARVLMLSRFRLLTERLVVRPMVAVSSWRRESKNVAQGDTNAHNLVISRAWSSNWAVCSKLVARPINGRGEVARSTVGLQVRSRWFWPMLCRNMAHCYVFALEHVNTLPKRRFTQASFLLTRCEKKCIIPLQVSHWRNIPIHGISSDECE